MQPLLVMLPFLLAAAAALETPMPDSDAPAREASDPKLASATSRFALDLYGELRRREGNVFCSPLSITTALAMTSAGARGETAEQMNRTLHLDRLGPQAHADLGLWIDSLRASIKDAQQQPGEKDQALQEAGLWMANAVWIDEREKLVPDFVALLDRSFRSKARAVDFAHAAAAARETINRWVEDQTRDKIKDLLKPSVVTSDTVVVLTSAIYFKGYWVHPFSAQATRDDDFRPAKGDPVRVKMMNQTTRLPYFEGEAFQALELPYKDGSLAMVVLLPKQADGLEALEASLSVENLDSWVAGLKPSRVIVSLPRFTSTVEAELKDVLTKLGMPLAFQGDADFSGITGSRDFAISAVVHKAFVEVEEKGTEAAAATAVVGVRSSAFAAKEIVFRADHPFLYLIRDTKTGAILFMGRLSRP
ncbi:MAG: serpin family protein [Paludisphaera borealis]|uniref:serpin family protein n=1 Tax=Paludisphaera borealis TaxID=1387353 RepID=UPI002848A521|nr:serpin family protein [Paludisphaera borealis]MDR3622126.1 serpin family protein [Paludisphaera borealis]